MPSRSPRAYLERQRLLTPVTLHRARFAMLSQKSHFRPIVHHPNLVGPDRPDRVKTQLESRRLPYVGVIHPRTR